jgi:hypothetical protein
MTRSHRIAHRWIFVALALVIPALLLAGIGLRPTVPPVSTNETLIRVDGFAADTGQDEVEIVGAGLRFGLTRLEDGRSVVIRPLEIIAKPDLLIYWSERPPTLNEDQGARIAEAELVGSLSGRSRRMLTLPQGSSSRASGGHLLVYSLGHGELLADLALSIPGSGHASEAQPPHPGEEEIVKTETN